MRALGLFCGLLFAAAGYAQTGDVQRALIQRDQQSDEFSQQLRQSQERLRVSPGDARKQRETETRQLQERQRLENLNARQRQLVGRGTPEALRPDERQKAADERRELVLPPPDDPATAPR